MKRRMGIDEKKMREIGEESGPLRCYFILAVIVIKAEPIVRIKKSLTVAFRYAI